MIICTVHFQNDKEDFSNLLKVWEYSARLHNPDADVRVLTVPEPEDIPRECDKYLTYSSAYAFLQMAKWAMKKNDKIIMTDADVMFTGNCGSIFKEDFDVAVTVRPARSWVNAGVLFMKAEGKAILQEIIDLTEKIIADPISYVDVLPQYLGADQTAITLLSLSHGLKRIPCHIWNLEQRTWNWFSEDTKIVHMKSNLWDLVQQVPPRIPVPEDHVTYRIFELWKSYLLRAGGTWEEKEEEIDEA